MCTIWQGRVHSGERSALCIWPHGQSDVSIGHAAFGVIWPQPKSGRSYFMCFAEQCRAVVKEVSLYQSSTNQPIISMRRYGEPSAMLQNSEGAWRCGSELDLASGGSCSNNSLSWAEGNSSWLRCGGGGP
jgi:hypothetical protein